MALLQTVALTTTILARPFIEPDAARAPSTSSRERASSRCRAKSERTLRGTDFQAAATTSRHVLIAANSDDALDRKAGQILDVVDQIRRAMIDLTVEQKRLVVIEVDRWVAMEEASHQPQQ
jgi:hypothetical protein